MSQDLVSSLIVILLLAILVLGQGLVKLRVPIESEVSRKIVHIGMGCLAVAFPWMFSSAMVVGLLTALACLAFIAIRFVPFLNKVLGGVNRVTQGEFYFTFGVAFAFYFSNGEPVLYCPPVLMMAIGDSLAALVGKALGRHRFTTDEDPKSWEGSLAFVISAFVTTFFALAVFSQLPIGNIFIISILLSMIGFMIESISDRGLDNLLVPVFGVMAMMAYYELEMTELLLRILALLAFLSIVFLFKRYSTMNDSALIGSALFLYVIWALVGWSWALSPLCLFLLFPFVVRFDYDEFENFQSVSSILFVNLAAFWWLTQSFRYDQPETYFWPFTASYALHLAMIWTKRAKFQKRGRLYLLSLAGFPALSTLCVQGLPALLSKQSGPWEDALIRIGITLLICSVVSGVILLVKEFDSEEGLTRKEWIFRTALAFGGSSMVFLSAPGQEMAAFAL